MNIERLEQEANLLHAHVCQGLGDPKRVLMLYLLAERPLNVTEVADALAAPQPTVSHHLKILRDRGLIRARKEGTSTYYSLTDHRIIEALDLMREIVADLLARRAGLMENARLGELSVSSMTSSEED